MNIAWIIAFVLTVICVLALIGCLGLVVYGEIRWQLWLIRKAEMDARSDQTMKDLRAACQDYLDIYAKEHEND